MEILWTYQEERKVMIMPQVIEGKEYLTQKEAMEFLGVSDKTFYKNYKDVLDEYTDPTDKRVILYKKADLLALKQPRHRPKD